MNPFVFVTALHGNEVLPSLALANQGYSQIIGNPRAVSRKVRFIEKDLNASFGTSGNSYEEKRARELLRIIPQEATVIDFHTTLSGKLPFAIVVSHDFVELAHSLGFNKIVYMKHNIKGGNALINHRNGVSIELGTHTDPQVFSRTLRVAQRALESKKKSHPYQLFEVYDIITKKGSYKNFALFQDGEESFYPVLSGKNSYEFFGLKARLLNTAEGNL